MRDRRLRVTMPEERIRDRPTDVSKRGIIIGRWKPDDF